MCISLIHANTIFLMAEHFGSFYRGLSQGLSKIGPTHQFTLLTDFGELIIFPAQNRRIESKDRGCLQPRPSAQEADDVGFQPINGNNYMRVLL